jgi:hypothetical protein
MRQTDLLTIGRGLYTIFHASVSVKGVEHLMGKVCRITARGVFAEIWRV